MLVLGIGSRAIRGMQRKVDVEPPSFAEEILGVAAEAECRSPRPERQPTEPVA